MRGAWKAGGPRFLGLARRSYRRLIPYERHARLTLRHAAKRRFERGIANASEQRDESARRRDPNRGISKPLVAPYRFDHASVDFRVVLVWPTALARAREAARCSALGARVSLRAHLLLVEYGRVCGRARAIAGSCLRERIEQIRLRHLRVDMLRKASDRDGHCR